MQSIRALARSSGARAASAARRAGQRESPERSRELGVRCALLRSRARRAPPTSGSARVAGAEPGVGGEEPELTSGDEGGWESPPKRWWRRRESNRVDGVQRAGRSPRGPDDPAMGERISARTWWRRRESNPGPRRLGGTIVHVRSCRIPGNWVAPIWRSSLALENLDEAPRGAVLHPASVGWRPISTTETISWSDGSTGF